MLNSEGFGILDSVRNFGQKADAWLRKYQPAGAVK